MLPSPSKGELFMKLVDIEYNCLQAACPNGPRSKQDNMTSHISWIYDSVRTMGKGDIFLIGGDFFFLDNNSNNPYYPGGMIQALTDAFSRGAILLTINDRYYLGGRDENGNCYGCKTKGQPFDCDKDSVNGSLYGSWACGQAQTQMQQLIQIGGAQYINYQIPNNSGLIHSHCKLISFYYPSKGLASFFNGSWNLNTDFGGYGLKETGIGFVCKLTEDFAQYNLWKDMYILKIFENYYGSSIKTPYSNYLEKMITGSNPPQVPITVPTVYFSGPNYCDPNFGCGAPVTVRTDCDGTNNESYYNTIDYNVEFTIGVSPPPQEGREVWQYGAQDWNDKGWNSQFVWGLDLLVQLINTSKKFIKTSIHSQCLDGGTAGDPNNPNPWGDIQAEFYNAIKNALSSGKQWFCLQNTGWEVKANNDGNTVMNQIRNDPDLWPNMYPKIFGVCGSKTIENDGATSPNPFITHDKLWITDNSILLSTSHPYIGQYSGNLLNYDILATNCPNFLNYMNNHWNMLWYNCGIYDPSYQPSGPYTRDLSVMTCSDPNDEIGGCCITPYFQKNTTDQWNYTGIVNNSPTPTPTPAPLPVPVPIPQPVTPTKSQEITTTTNILPVSTSIILTIITVIIAVLIIYKWRSSHLMIFLTTIVVIAILIFAWWRKSTTTTIPGIQPKPQPPIVNLFPIEGAGNNEGMCYFEKKSHVIEKEVDAKTVQDISKICALDDTCTSFSYNAETMKGITYHDKNKKLYPYYSTIYDCPDNIQNPIEVGGCRPDYPEACTKLDSGWKCYSKKIQDYGPPAPITYISQSTDYSGCSIIISNPYLPYENLINTQGTFYWWFHDLLETAETFIILANTYVKLGIHTSEEPTNYQNKIYYALARALKRNVQVTIVNDASEAAQCQADFQSQPGIKEYLGKNLNYITFSNTPFGFFHDKIYISDKKAYVGGQNLSASSSIDIGFSIPASSSLYNDVLQKALFLANNGNFSVNFLYTMNAPYVAGDTLSKYFVAVSPYLPICNNNQPTSTSQVCQICQNNDGSCNFPQTECVHPTQPVGQYVYGNLTTFAGNVSYEWNQVYDIVKNATDFITLTNFDWSIFGDSFEGGIGSDKTINDEILAAATRGVIINIWINNSPFTDGICHSPNSTCNMFRCSDSNSWLNTLVSYKNVSMHWWYQNPVSKTYNDYCKTLHGKLYYSDYGMLISSSNFTPAYFGASLNTGIAVIFNDKDIPDYISTSIKNYINILQDHASGDGKHTCDNGSTPNFQTMSEKGETLCDDNTCTNTCMKRAVMYPCGN